MQAPRCAKCGAPTEAGFVLDKGVPGGSVSTPEWVEGEPKQSFWSGVSTRGRERHGITTFRCNACGYLESYAAT